MCGICGWIGKAEGLESEYLPRMIDAIGKRGRDGRGLWVDKRGRAALGHTRLSIIDIDGSAQPMSNEDGTIIVTFNGEIYNYRELRALLKSRGHVFKTEGDTEVLVHMYEEFGSELVRQLDGIFAFCIYDSLKQVALLARDRIGVKPLYYYEDPQREYLIFASDLWGMLAHPLVPRSLNCRALAQYLHFGYAVQPESWLTEVRQVRPGECIVRKDDRSRVFRYYEWTYEADEGLADRGRALQTLKQTLEESVALQMVADAPLGTFLSGGIDSTVVTALAQREREKSGDRIRSCSVKFWTAELDESERARAIASAIGTDHQEIDAIRLPFNRAVMDRVVEAMGEPFGDTSALGVLYLCESVARHLKVTLSGDGGDELFFGYTGLRKQRLAAALRSSPAVARQFLISIAGNMRCDPIRKLKKTCELSLLDNAGLIIEWHRRWDQRELDEAVDRDAIGAAPIGGSDCFPEVREIVEGPRPRSLAESQMAFHMHVDLPCDCLFKVDRMSMASGLEVRVPLLSNMMLKFAERLPARVRSSWKRTKEPLRSLGESLCPVLRERFRKRGFSFPLDAWLGGSLAQNWRDWQISSCLALIGFNSASIDAMVREYDEQQRAPSGFRRRSLARRLFDLMVLGLWVERTGVS